MESKNVKVIDEHGIDRNANVICSIDVDGSDYVIYWIERDSDNDNLFVSKLVKNNDGTSNMINVDDSLEKGNLSEIVKELVMHSINDDNDKLAQAVVTLKNGKSVKIGNVLFNKEQNINVQKTYVTTVKKSVTSVSEKYYHVDAAPTKDSATFESPEAVFSNTQTIPEAIPSEAIMPSIGEVPEKVVEPVVAPSELAPAPVTPSVEPVVAPSEPAPAPVTPSVEPVVAPSEPAPAPVTPSVEPVVAPVQSTPVTPVPAPQPAVQAVASPSAPTESANNDSVLFFDGSKETNLANTSTGKTDQSTVAVDAVQPIREFGQDIPVVNDVKPEVDNVKPQSQGFANNKFFMVIAIVFFLASCVFLGYEAFKFFQMK